MERRSAWRVLSIVLYGAIAGVSLARLADLTGNAVLTDPVPLLAALAVSLVSAGLLVAAARLAPVDRIHLPLFAGAFALMIGLRVAALLTVPAPVTADWLRYHEIALDIASNGPRFDVVPTGFPIVLGLIYRVFGPDPVNGQVFQIVVATGIGAIVYTLAARVWNHRVALLALLIYATFPSQILIGTVLASEPLYTLLIVAAVAGLTAWPGLVGAAGIGLILGLSQYVRATSLALTPLLALVAWRWTDVGRAWLRPLVLLAVFSIVLLPVVAWNAATLGVPSPSTSRIQNYSLMIGLNQASGGRWTLEDYRRVGSEVGTPSSERIAGRVAMERLTEDPVGIAWLAIRKFEAWGEEDYGAYWAIGAADANGGLHRFAILASHLWWTALAMLVVAGALMRRHENPLTEATTLLVVAVTLIHAVLETQGRYHSYLVPLLAALGAAGLAAILPGPAPEWRRQTSDNE